MPFSSLALMAQILLFTSLSLLLSCQQGGEAATAAQVEAEAASEPGLSTKSLAKAPSLAPSPCATFMARDGTELAYRAYLPEEGEPPAIVVFYHGGGAHSGASYQHVGIALSERYNLAAFTPDIRGHGCSGGERGDAPHPDQVLADVGSFIDFIRLRYPATPLFVGGHSSGAGLVLNYSTHKKSHARSGAPSGYLFVAPHFGYRSKTEREDIQHAFTEVHVSDFVLHSMSFGLFNGHAKAVHFHYEKSLLERDPLMVSFNTVNMALALTPGSPSSQLRGLPQPAAVWAAEEDSLLDPRKLETFVTESAPQASFRLIKKEGHLSILLVAGDLIGPWVLKQL